MAGNRDKRDKSDSVAPDVATDMPLMIPPGARNNLLWTIHLLARQNGAGHLRFRSRPGLAFTPGEVETVRKSGSQEYELQANVGGLDGISGPLPLWLNEILSREEPDEPGGAPVGAFLDIFSHRFISSLYQAWSGRSPALAYERGGKDAISRILFCLLGICFPDTLDETGGGENNFHPARLLPYVGTLGHRNRSAASLQGMLRDYFDGISLSVSQFVLRRVTIPVEEQTRLGRQGMCIGKDFVPGEKVEDISGAFRIVIGPLDMSEFEQFLPGGIHYLHLVRLVKMYISYLMAWDISLKIRGESVPSIRLGEEIPKLGRSMWLRSAWYETGSRTTAQLRSGHVPENICMAVEKIPVAEYPSEEDLIRLLNQMVPPDDLQRWIPEILKAAFRSAPKEDDEVIFNTGF